MIGVFDDVGSFGEGDLGNLRHEGGVTTVVRPVGVEHAELGDGGFAVLALEILLGVDEVAGGHGEAEFAAVGVEVGLGFGIEAGEDGDVVWDGAGLGLGLGGDGDLVGIDGVDEVFFDRGELGVIEVSGEDNDAGGGDEGAVFSGEDLDALGGGIGPLVELAREELDGEGFFGGGQGEFGGRLLNLRLGEDELGGLGEFWVGEAIEIVSLQDAGGLDGVDSEVRAEVGDEMGGLGIEGRNFFDEKTMHDGKEVSGKAGGALERDVGV